MRESRKYRAVSAGPSFRIVIAARPKLGKSPPAAAASNVLTLIDRSSSALERRRVRGKMLQMTIQNDAHLLFEVSNIPASC